jgi:hypothetical protein
MTTLEQRLHAGSRAKEVLENEAFTAAFEAIEQEVIDQWTNSPARDQDGREKLWAYLHLLKKVRTHLTSTLETGKLAQIELQHQQSLRDRARQMGAGLFSRVA